MGAMLNFRSVYAQMQVLAQKTQALYNAEFKKKVLYLVDALDNLNNCLESLPETHTLIEERESALGLQMDHRQMPSSDAFVEVGGLEPI